MSAEGLLLLLFVSAVAAIHSENRSALCQLIVSLCTRLSVNFHELRGGLNQLASLLEDERVDMKEVCDLMLRIAQEICLIDLSEVAQVPQSQTIEIFFRKAELLQELHNSAIPQFTDEVVRYEGNFLPMSFLRRREALPTTPSSLVISSEIYRLEQSINLTPSHSKVIIGHQTDVSVPLNSSSVLNIRKEGNLVVITESATVTPTARVGLKQDVQYPVRSGQLFLIGNFMLMIEKAVSDLIQVRWKQAEERFTSPFSIQRNQFPVFNIGRAPDCNLLLNHGSVSKHHACLVSTEKGWMIRDLGATNGTYRLLHTAYTLYAESEELLITEETTLFYDRDSRIVIQPSVYISGAAIFNSTLEKCRPVYISN